MKRYTVILEQAESNWAAYVPDLPGCITTGKTREATTRNIREAIELHIEAMREAGEAVPEPAPKGSPAQRSWGGDSLPAFREPRPVPG